MSTEPSPEVVDRGITVLVPFVRSWGLPLNPEDLGLMAYAVLKYADDDTDLEEIIAQIEKLIKQNEQENQNMRNAMAAMVRAQSTSRPQLYDQDKEN